MTMIVLAGIGLKSIATAGIALALLWVLRGRSAAERSLVGHAGIAATLLLPVLVLAGPQWPVEPPQALAWIEPAAAPQAVESAAPAAPALAAAAAAGSSAWPSAEQLAPWFYAVPAALLLLVTLVAVLRLFSIRARAAVLTEPQWLAALAHAQRRMGFKNGAALLTSDELGSPVSWGLFRPTIVLNRDAAGSAAEAEAIIAHELAHVVRWDWLKLLAARTATALFWFNPLVWLLARQCHQLREEAADDAVLAGDVPGPDYAQLLVGAARHESRGTLLAANGVAPGRDSLKRRVTRVLDAGISRRPGGIGWRAGCALAAVAVSAPLAALTPAADLAAAAVERDVPAHGDDRGSDLRLDLAADVRDAEVDAALDETIHAEAEAVAEPVAEAEAAAAAALVQQIELRPFDAVEVTAGGALVLRPGGTFAVRSGGRIDPGRFRVEGGRLTVLPCTTDCAAGPVEVVLPALAAVAVNGGGSIVAGSGFPRSAAVAIAVRGGGTADLRAVPIDAATAAVNSGGTILVRPARTLTGAVHAGGEIVYWGDPQVTQAVSAGGSIRRGGPS